MLQTGSYLTLFDPAVVHCVDEKQAARLDHWPAQPNLAHLKLLCSFAQFVYEHKQVETVHPLIFKTFEPSRFGESKIGDPHGTCNCIWFPVVQYAMLYLEDAVEQALARLPSLKTAAARLDVRIQLQDALGVWTYINEHVMPKWTDKAAEVFLLDCRKRLGEARAMCRWLAFFCHFADDTGKFPLAAKQSMVWCSIVECQRHLSGKNQERVARVVSQSYQHAVEMCMYHFAHEQAEDKEFGVAMAAAAYFKVLGGKRVKLEAEWKHQNDTIFKQPVPTDYPKGFDWDFIKKTVSTLNMFIKGQSFVVVAAADIWQIKTASKEQSPSPVKPPVKHRPP